MPQTPAQIAAAKLLADETLQAETEQKETELAKGSTSTKTSEMVKPKEVVEVCEIVSVSPALKGTNGDYHIVTYFNESGAQETIALSSALKSTVTDVTMAIGKSVNVTFTRNIAGKTQWLNKTTGEVAFHRSTTVNLVRVASTTNAQEKDLSREATFAFAAKKNVSKMITEAADADKIALSNLYASMLRG